MGPSRKTMIQNRDIIKELKVGMLIAIAESDIARVGKVLAIPSNISLDSNITIQWMVQERAPHKNGKDFLNLGKKMYLEKQN